MSELQTIKIPDIGDIDDVEVIEVLVSTGDTIAPETSLITVESDKASMEIPSPVAGVVTSVLINTGDKVSTGSDILVVDVAASEGATKGASDGAADNSAANNDTSSADAAAKAASDSAAASSAATESSSNTASASNAAAPAIDAHPDAFDLVVLGAGPGGYTAAFRAADLGLNVALIERYPDLGGVCLNVGCIPSKALLHTAAVITEASSLAAHGISFGKPDIDINKLRGFKEEVIGKLTGGLAGLAKQRKVTVMHGLAEFSSPTSLAVGDETVHFKQAVIAAGSSSIRIPGFPYDDERLIDSTGALELTDIPKRLLVIGGGIIGLEMGCVYSALGSQVTVVELSDGLVPGCDRDLVRPLQKRLENDFENIFIGSGVTAVESAKDGLKVSFEGGKAPATDTFDRVLLAVGRSPNGKSINAEAAGVEVDERGFIKVDSQQHQCAEYIRYWRHRRSTNAGSQGNP